MTKIKIGFFLFGMICTRLIEHFHYQCYPKYLLFEIKKKHKMYDLLSQALLEEFQR